MNTVKEFSKDERRKIRGVFAAANELKLDADELLSDGMALVLQPYLDADPVLKILHGDGKLQFRNIPGGAINGFSFSDEDYLAAKTAAAGTPPAPTEVKVLPSKRAKK